MTLALVRHGRTAWNRDRRMQGRTDIDLDEFGREQARAVGEMLARQEWARIVSSPLGRARETAKIIGRRLADIPLLIDDDLVERDYGAAEGLGVAEAHERWPSHDYPGAEDLAAVARRSAARLASLSEREGSTIVVAHGTVLRVGIETLTGADCPRILNGEVISLERDYGAAFRAVQLTTSPSIARPPITATSSS